MDINKYFDELDKKLEEMPDEEFDKLLKDSGIDKCPLTEEKDKSDFREECNNISKTRK